jgi:hypothetical protein
VACVEQDEQCADAVASSNGSRRYAAPICGAATGGDPCRSQTPSKWCSGGGGGLLSDLEATWTGATKCGPAALVRIRHQTHKRQYAGTCTVEARPLSGTRLWRLALIGRERGRAVTFARTGVACLRCCCVQAWDSGGCSLGGVAAKPKRKGPGITKGARRGGRRGDEVTPRHVIDADARPLDVREPWV